MKLVRKLLLVWMIAWLPAAGVMAAVMPLSGSMGMSVLTDSASVQPADISFMPCHGKSMPGKMAFGQGCTHCVLCHLAGALVMPELPVVATVAPTHLFDSPSPASHASFIPELNSPPPRLALA